MGGKNIYEMQVLHFKRMLVHGRWICSGIINNFFHIVSSAEEGIYYLNTNSFGPWSVGGWTNVARLFNKRPNDDLV